MPISGDSKRDILSLRALTALAVASVVGLMIIADAGAAGKKKPQVIDSGDGKRVVAFAGVEQVRIEMPDREFHDFGHEFHTRIRTKLGESGRLIVADPDVSSRQFALRSVKPLDPNQDWAATYVPAATVFVNVEGMTFVTGYKGSRMLYGFDDRSRTPFNDGHGTLKNEFPLRDISFEPNWFDRTFDKKGVAPFDSLAGLDLGEGLSLDVLFAWLSVKYASYRADLHLKVNVDAPLAGVNEDRLVHVKGQGFFFDVVGAYKGYSGGIMVARRDAMLKALRRSVDGAYGAIERAVAGLPLTARIDNVVDKTGELLLGTGFDARVKPGVRYEVVDAPGVIIEVVKTVKIGSIAKVISGDSALASAGRIVRQVQPGAALPAATRGLASVRSVQQGLAASETIELPKQNLPKADFQGTPLPAVDRIGAWLLSVLESSMLPYRLWRYSQYDQSYSKAADGAEYGQEKNVQRWAEHARESSWAKQIGLDQVPLSPESSATDPVVVAVIDSGIDYNHPALHDALWLNPSPTTDWRGMKDRYGWDFVSGDSRPFDDHFHGTEVASALVAVAPFVKVMPVKVFNPWGITHSASMYSAFKYAVDHGAKIILCGWATRQPSKAIELGVAYAREHGVVVVAAAGDRGESLEEVPAFPASLSERYENVLTVTGVDTGDQIVRKHKAYANFGVKQIALAAPGQDIYVADPRSGDDHVTSTGISAAIAAGGLARVMATESSKTPVEAKQNLLQEAEVVPGLVDQVQGGLRLRVMR